MLTSGELRHAYRVAVNSWLDDNNVADDYVHDAGLRAVEDAVRADQIEKDAQIADERHRKVQDESALIAWRIREQLPPELRAQSGEFDK